MVGWIKTVLNGGHGFPPPNQPLTITSKDVLIFVGVVLLFVIGYGVAKRIWEED